MITTLRHVPLSALRKDQPDPHSARSGRARRPLLRLLGYMAAFLLPPLLVAAWSVGTALSSPAIAPAPDEVAPPPPAHDPDKPTAVVVAGVNGAESIDTLVPYQLFAESGRFNVYTVAPQREVVPLFPGSPQLQGVELLPHLSLADYDHQIGVAPDVIVVPWVPSHEDNEPLLGWLRRHATADTTVLTICGGSWTAAQAGLPDGRAATGYGNLLPMLRPYYPSVEWVEGRRWVEDGNIVSSAGITAAFDATLRVLEQRVGREVAAEVAARVGYPHTRFLDDPTYPVAPADRTARTVQKLAMAYGCRYAVGVALYDGVSEIDLAAIVDVYPRTHASVVETIATTGIVTTRHGLHLVPRHDIDDAPPLDRLLVPGDPGAEAAELLGWAEASATPVRFVHDGDGFAIDAALADLADTETRAAAVNVARGIEYPIDATLLPGGRSWPHALALRPLAMGLLGPLAAAAVARIRRGRGKAA